MNDRSAISSISMLVGKLHIPLQEKEQYTGEVLEKMRKVEDFAESAKYKGVLQVSVGQVGAKLQG